MSDLKPSGFANVGRLEDNRNIKSLQNIGNKVTMGTSAPVGSEGQIGDITVRLISRLGYRIYIKTPSGWIDVNSMIAPDTVEWRDMILPTNISHDVAGTTPMYGKDASGFVHLRGLINIAGGTGSITITTLPPGYRPAKDVHVPGCHDQGFVVYKIDTDGVLNAPGNTTTADVSLDGVSFFAWQTPISTGGGSGGHELDPGSGGGALP